MFNIICEICESKNILLTYLYDADIIDYSEIIIFQCVDCKHSEFRNYKTIIK